MGRLIPLLIVDDVYLNGQCLAAKLAPTGRFAPIDLAGGVTEALWQIKVAPPEVALVNWDLAGGVAPHLTRQLVREAPAVKVFLLGAPEALGASGECAGVGCAACVPRQTTFEELLARVGQAVGDEASPTFAASHGPCPPPRLHDVRTNGHGEVPGVPLTSRERQVLELIWAGLSNKEIAGWLHLSLHTVKNHVHNILEKTGLPGRHAAAQHLYGRQ
jgi:DNA-binding NarL/FixJ family response regulator